MFHYQTRGGVCHYSTITFGASTNTMRAVTHLPDDLHQVWQEARVDDLLDLSLTARSDIGQRPGHFSPQIVVMRHQETIVMRQHTRR